MDRNTIIFGGATKQIRQAMTIQTLTNAPIEQILETFNRSFSDYLVPLQLTKEQLERKIHSIAREI